MHEEPVAALRGRLGELTRRRAAAGAELAARERALAAAAARLDAERTRLAAELAALAAAAPCQRPLPPAVPPAAPAAHADPAPALARARASAAAAAAASALAAAAAGAASAPAPAAAAAAARLMAEDYVVLDGLWAAAECGAMRDALCRLHGEGLFREGEMYGAARDAKDRGDSIYALPEGERAPQCAAPLLRFQRWADTFVGQVAIELHRAGSADGTARGGGPWTAARRSALQCTLYPGGGARYVRHVDDPDGRYRRRLTLLLYLNPGWSEPDGGELELYHAGQETVAAVGQEVEAGGTGSEIDGARGRIVGFLPQGAAVAFEGLGVRPVPPQSLRLCGDRPRARVAPEAGRLLLFWSDRRCPHAVAPSRAQRWAVTCWYHDD
eukprot:TRINITY_DN15108_c0_g5_i1.p1 TRINITY_DN15108_c0_g5~~TRINITY_DN15108_c0_g5_i1.p1  ORF type:complete len:409 (+),score=120.95 TRINITY_DN15108_c0_g5_i1:76-1227(+)